MIAARNWKKGGFGATAAGRTASVLPALLLAALALWAGVAAAGCGGRMGNADTGPPARAVTPGYCGPMCEMAFWMDAGVAEVQAALAHGIDLTARRGVLGGAAIHLAAAYTSDPEVIDLLIEAGSDIEYRSGAIGSTALHAAASLNPDAAITALLLARGADIAARNLEGRTALHAAAAMNLNPAVVALLLEHGRNWRRGTLRWASRRCTPPRC